CVMLPTTSPPMRARSPMKEGPEPLRSSLSIWVLLELRGLSANAGRCLAPLHLQANVGVCCYCPMSSEQRGAYNRVEITLAHREGDAVGVALGVVFSRHW